MTFVHWPPLQHATWCSVKALLASATHMKLTCGVGWCGGIPSTGIATQLVQKTIDWESGLQGWTKAGGTLGMQPATYQAATDSKCCLACKSFVESASDVCKNNQGDDIGGKRLFRSDYDGNAKVGDGRKGSFISPPFTLGEGMIEWHYSGDGGDDCYIALVDATSGQVLLKSSPKLQSTAMKLGQWSTTELSGTGHIGRSVRLKITDDATGPWGHIAVDNIAYYEGYGCSMANLGALLQNEGSGVSTWYSGCGGGCGKSEAACMSDCLANADCWSASWSGADGSCWLKTRQLEAPVSQYPTHSSSGSHGAWRTLYKSCAGWCTGAPLYSPPHTALHTPAPGAATCLPAGRIQSLACMLACTVARSLLALRTNNDNRSRKRSIRSNDHSTDTNYYSNTGDCTTTRVRHLRQWSRPSWVPDEQTRRPRREFSNLRSRTGAGSPPAAGRRM